MQGFVDALLPGPAVERLDAALQRVEIVPWSVGLVALAQFAHLGEALAGGVEDGDARLEGRLLRHVGDAQALLELEDAVVGLFQPGQDLEQRGLAGAVAADQADALARFHGERRSVEQGDVAEGQVCVGEGDECHGGPGIIDERISLPPTMRADERDRRARRKEMTGMSRQRGAILAWVAILVAAVALGLWFGGRDGERAAPKVEVVPRAVLARGDLAADEQTNIEVFRTASPSVVHITTLQNQSNFFSLDVTQIPRGTGSGFIWDERGHVVTNFHVIQGGDAARVTLSDQSNYKAALVGAYPDRDLAVLRIDAPTEKLRALAVGESKNLIVGQKVYAIGNPFGLDQTLTTGIVSALNREIESVTRRAIPGVIQTDAAINPGNSGGPLLDSAGRLIGVNTAIFSPSGASAGIGFAIPVDEVNRVIPRLIRDGRVVRPTLGVGVAPPDSPSRWACPLVSRC